LVAAWAQQRRRLHLASHIDRPKASACTLAVPCTCFAKVQSRFPAYCRASIALLACLSDDILYLFGGGRGASALCRAPPRLQATAAGCLYFCPCTCKSLSLPFLQQHYHSSRPRTCGCLLCPFRAFHVHARHLRAAILGTAS
jgi:hypothetical protein